MPGEVHDRTNSRRSPEAQRAAARRRSRGSAHPPEFQPSPKIIAKHSAAPQPPTWQVVRDVLTGRAAVHINYQTEFRVNETTVIQREFGSISQVDPSDPAHASVRGWHVCRSARGGPNHVTQGRTDVLIQSTGAHFHITIDLEVRVNDAPHFSKRWVESVPRELL